MSEDWTQAQRSVVGSVLIDPKVLPMVLRLCKPSDMTGSCATIYAAMQELSLGGTPVDPVTVLARIGPAYEQELMQLMQLTPTAANAEAYAQICAEQAQLARLHALAMQLTEARRMEDALPLIQGMTEQLGDHNARRISTLNEAMTSFCERHDSGAQAPEYIPFGLPKLDQHLTAELGDVIVLGGYPSDGKSAMMLQWAWELSKRYRVGIFSLETSTRKLTDRFAAQAAAIRMDHIKQNALSNQEWDQTILMGRQMAKREQIDLIEAAGSTVTDILATALARKHQVVMIDYVQLIRPGTQRRGGTRNEEVAEISMALHTMAQRHGILVVELSQLSRPQGTGKGKALAPPTLASLRESGQLEQDADIVMLLYRTKPDSLGSPRRLHIAKNKEGTTGMVDLRFVGSIQRFEEADGEDEDLDRRFAGETKKRREREHAARSGQEELPV